jgi:hypothetical protein
MIIKTHKQNYHNNNNNDNQTIKSINKKLKDNNAIVTTADKTKNIVIIDHETYIDKTQKFMNENKYIKIKKDPTTKYNNIIKTIIEQNPEINKNNKHKYRIQNPQPPTLNALPKLHKKDIPIRPLVNFKSAPSYKISKLILQQLQTLIELPNKYNVKNSTELINKINNTQITEKSKIYSFDIKNLYTNIPIKETINIIENKLKDINSTTDNIKYYTNALQNILQQNYCTFNNEIFIANDGLAMGSPLSGFLSEIFIQEHEDKLINSLNKTYNITFWARYVDDIICIFDNTVDPTIALNNINNIHKHLQFTIEEEQNKQINFLDLTISKNRNNKIEFNIYRKPTDTNNIIHNNSNHPQQHKKAYFTFAFNRLINTPLNKINYRNEFNNIIKIGINNGYTKNYITNIYNKLKHKKQAPPLNTNNDTANKYITFNYTDKDTHQITKLFKNHKIAYQTNNKLLQKLHKPKNNNIYNKSGIYKLTCNTCNNIYIGKTNRTMNIRYKEHMNALKNPVTYHSHFANHLFNNNHPNAPIEETLTILKPSNNKNLNIKEFIEIYKHKQNYNLINDQINCNFETILNPLKSLHLPRKPNSLPP